MRISRDSKNALRRSRCAFAIEVVGVTADVYAVVVKETLPEAVPFRDRPETQLANRGIAIGLAGEGFEIANRSKPNTDSAVVPPPAKP